MERLITKMKDLYDKEKENKKKGLKDSPNNKKDLIEKIYIISHNKISKEKEDNNKTNNNKEFSLPSFQSLNNKEILSYIENNNIPNKYLNKALKEIFKVCNKDNKSNNNIFIKFIEKYKDNLSEINIIYIFKKINDLNNISNKKIINDIIKFILNNIQIDEKYFFELLKEENIYLNKNLIESINACNSRDKISLIKTLNLISLTKEIINQEEYNKYEEKLNKIYEEELNKRENKEKICEEEFNKDFNMEFINSMKIINSNSNKTYFIQETIKI